MFYAFTSITANYIPKARVLAWSLKRLHPEIHFCLLLAEPLPPDLDHVPGTFDEIETVDCLGITNLEAWLFKHNVVEVCTAVKGLYLERLLQRNDCEGVLYLDPDLLMVSSLKNAVLDQFDSHSILLTPHLLEPEVTRQAIVDNELSALKHGIYNLGFLGVKSSPQGRSFASWWSSRLQEFCYIDFDSGLFTDQRWVDLAPAYFTEVGILRDVGCNVASWNLTHRHIEGSLQDGLLVNGQPLVFYHFSGFDSGANMAMLLRYGREMPALFQLRDWYIRKCAEFGSVEFGKRQWSYNEFDNGEVIKQEARRLYRSDLTLQQRFPQPFSTNGDSYFKWLKEREELKTA
jgi:hypothetical protein